MTIPAQQIGVTDKIFVRESVNKTARELIDALNGIGPGGHRGQNTIVLLEFGF